jgi:hypothetical protein
LSLRSICLYFWPFHFLPFFFSFFVILSYFVPLWCSYTLSTLPSFLYFLSSFSFATFYFFPS